MSGNETTQTDEQDKQAVQQRPGPHNEHVGGLDIEQAVRRLCDLYERATARAAEILAMGDYAAYSEVVYPRLVVDVHTWHPVDRSQSFGYVDAAGRYSATLSKPHIMRRYLTEQLGQLARNYDCTITVEPSTERIPPEYIAGVDDVSEARRAGDLGDAVPRPTLDAVHDAIVDGEWDAFHRSELPLFHFGAQRFDIACERIAHYTGITVDTLQRFLLFTNYAMHTNEFLGFALAELTREGSRYHKLVLSDGYIIDRSAAAEADVERLSLGNRQMPRIDLVAADGMGITMINIGVGPSNAKTITDCVAVLRPEAWIMIGHCAGLDGRMRIGDLILGNAYQRADGVLDEHIPVSTPIPAVPEVQRALEASVAAIYGDHSSLMRTGTVLSTGDRNWEWRSPRGLWEWLRGSTAAAVDMESCTLAANGYRYRVPYGALLSVSDLPLHAVPKLPAQAQAFYSNSKEAHVMCAVRAVEALAANPERLHTRKLRRTVAEVPFR